MSLVLYTDDDEVLLDIGKIFLENTGDFTIETALSVRDAYIILKNRPVDCIVSEYLMPDMDGIKFLKTLRKEGNPVPFIIFTGKGREEVVIEALNSGADYYLQKGADPKSQFRELSRKIQRAIERKRTSKIIIESERRYRTIVEDQTEIISRFLPDGTQVFVNEAYCRYFGMKQDEILGTRFHPKDPAEDRDAIRQLFTTLTPEDPVNTLEQKIIMPDGTNRWQQWNNRAIFDKHGSVLEYQSVGRDISAIKKKEEELRAQYAKLEEREKNIRNSERQLQGIVHGSPIPQFVIDIDHRIISWNRALEEITGVKAKEVLGTTDAWKAFYPEKRPVLADLLVDGTSEGIDKWYHGKSARSRFVEGAFEAIDHFSHAGKPETWLLFTAAVIRDGDGKIIGAVETLEDITERRRALEALEESERKLRALFDQTYELIGLLTPDGIVIDTNRTALEFSGIPATDITGRPFWETPWWTHSPELQERLREAVRKVSGGEFVRFEATHHAEDGSLHTIDFSLKPVKDDTGRVIYLIPEGRDITERKQAENALRHSEEKLALKLDSILSPETDIGDLELINIIDGPMIQSLMEVFTQLTGMVTAVLDLNGNVIVATGWQDICTKFHRVNAITARFCVESDLFLAKNLKPGEYVSYRCKNNLWDVVTPLYIGNKHAGNIYTGQFLFDHEPVDESVFVSQAEMYGFDKDEYLSALHRVPRCSREYINRLMDFLSELTGIISRLSYSNLKLARSMAEQKRTREVLELSERRLTDIISHLPDATLAIDRDGKIIAWNRAMEEMSGVHAADMLGRGDYEYSVPLYGVKRPLLLDLVLHDVKEIRKNYPEIQRAGDQYIAHLYVPTLYGGKGAYVWCIASPLYDTEGGIIGAIESVRDVSEQKRADDALTQARKKLNLLNAITFSDIRNSVFSLLGYLQIHEALPADEKSQQYTGKEIGIVQTISSSLKYAEIFQSLGLKPPVWQNVGQSFLMAISHMDISKISRSLNVSDLEIYADPMLENVFFTLADNIVKYANTATEYSLTYTNNPEGLILIFEDNGPGIPQQEKEKIFNREYGSKTGVDLYLSREILSITGISIRETGEPGKGARFEIGVPKGMYRICGIQRSDK